MNKIQKTGIFGLGCFYFVIFGTVLVFKIYWLCKSICMASESCGPVAWVIGIGVLVYLLFFAMAMQAE